MDNPIDKILVTIFSDANFLAINVLENLLTRKSYVNIITSDPIGWIQKTKHIANNSRFSILDNRKKAIQVSSSYTYFFGGFLNKDLALDSFDNFVKNNYDNQIKTIAVFPFEIFDKYKSERVSINNNLAIVYIGDLLGPRIDLESDLVAPTAINQILQERSLTLSVGEMFYPIFVSDAAKLISKWMLSFGPFGKETFLLGPQTSGNVFWEENQKIVSNVNLKYDSNLKSRIVPRNYETENINCDLHLSLVETYRWLSMVLKGGIMNSKKGTLRKISEIRDKIKIPKPVKFASFFITIVLTLPIFSLMISAIFFYFSYKSFILAKTDNVESTILIAKTFSVLAKEEARFLSYIPLLGRIYKEVSFAGRIGEKFSDISMNSVPVVENAGELFKNVLGNEIYDPSQQSEEIKIGLDTLYQNISTVQLETKEGVENGIQLAKLLITKIDLEKLRNYTLQGITISENLPKILGKDKPQTYFILFENNMELRPTGGFIGSYGLMTFDSGRMSDLTVNDVYSADGQLNGHVEPPAPIKDYLGEANWWLRDSNWDPDFPTSARRAEWFLNKEIGREVDGVVAVDLEPIKQILKHTGSVFLPDFNLDISDQNLYEKTQSEVQDNFFPGTHKKASFLTALSRSILTNLNKLDSKKRLLVLRSLIDGLDGRHIQIFLHNEPVQTALSNISWDGAIVKPFCGNNCYGDIVGLVEANVGVNKANYFVKKDINIKTHLDDNKINRKLTLNIKNSANTALGVAGKYKVYLRLMISSDAEVVGVTTPSGDSEVSLPADITQAKDRKEVGVLVEVLGGQSKEISFLWRTNLDNTDPVTSYGLFFRKQAGSSDDPLNIAISRNGSQITSIPKFSLTQGGDYVYNTVLARDFFSRISW
ncbi:MAG TPA: DUF4012 domain-containing protein [Patescibacteria group bacterium]|nr:DUF4012 domain-containing protein [Patescibacteria group bacterium]